MEQPENMPNVPLVGAINQIGIVVRDVDECVKNYEKFFGEGSFTVMEGEASATLADGREVNIKGKLAFAQLGPVQVELIEIKEGPSITPISEEHGEVHHVAVSRTILTDAEVLQERRRCSRAGLAACVRTTKPFI
jgi:hypothetical protein